MKPPWEAFPTYERYTIGWRMGPGESYLYDWADHVRSIPEDFQARLDYLRSHRPAPLSWSGLVLRTLYVQDEERQEVNPSTLAWLLELKLVEHDAAYQTWLLQQDAALYPWDIFGGESPEVAARYSTRELWFVSRWLVMHRHTLSAPHPIPSAWEPFATELQTGELGEVTMERGLFTLAQMLCAGEVRPPWSFGLSVESFEDSFELDMGFSDAFRLWLMCAFDDEVSLWRVLPPKDTIPTSWQGWLEEQLVTGF